MLDLSINVVAHHYAGTGYENNAVRAVRHGYWIREAHGNDAVQVDHVIDRLQDEMKLRRLHDLRAHSPQRVGLLHLPRHLYCRVYYRLLYELSEERDERDVN